TCRDDVVKLYNAQTYTSHGYCKQGNQLDVKFCRNPSCNYCLVQPETATIHSDCFNLFSQRCKISDKYYRLWQASISIRPWPHSNHLCIPFQGEIGDLLVLSELFHPLLKRLPLEVIDMVGSLIGPNFIWRYRTVLKRIESLESTPAVKDCTLRLCDIKHWRRYQLPVICDTSPTAAYYVQITIDSGGIKAIDRTTAPKEEHNIRPTQYQLFIVEKAAKLCGVNAHLQAGYCRLQFYQPTWMKFSNCPLLPEVYHEVIPVLTKPKCTSAIRKATQVETYSYLSLIDTASCFGLTLFLHHHQILAVHAHTSITPTAHETFLRLTPVRRQAAIWFYVALPVGEEITALGGSAIDSKAINGLESKSLFIQTKHQGLLQAGQCNNEQLSVQLMTPTSGRPLLVHDVVSGFISLFSRSSRTTTHYLQARTPLLDCAYAGQAALENVMVAQTFMDCRTGQCRGIIFQYNDGKVKSIGQCRLGVDETRCVEHPARVCSMTVDDTLTVEFAWSDAHSHTPVDSDAKWECHEMTGTLNLWFDLACAKISIT
ncbi:hypothetical protein LLEC1_07954, partial [Akanthomyces lecanii]